MDMKTWHWRTENLFWFLLLGCFCNCSGNIDKKDQELRSPSKKVMPKEITVDEKQALMEERKLLQDSIQIIQEQLRDLEKQTRNIRSEAPRTVLKLSKEQMLKVPDS